MRQHIKRRSKVARATVKVARATVRFDPLTGADLPELESMVLALYREDPTGRRMSIQKVRRTVAELSAHPDAGDIIVFRDGGTIVGYTIVIYFWSNEYGGHIAHIDELYIRPGWRNMGIGSASIRHVAGRKNKRLKGLRLEVTPANRKAFAFYSRLGFTPERNRHMFCDLRRAK